MLRCTRCFREWNAPPNLLGKKGTSPPDLTYYQAGACRWEQRALAPSREQEFFPWASQGTTGWSAKGSTPTGLTLSAVAVLMGGKNQKSGKGAHLEYICYKKKNSTEPEQMKFGFPLCKSAVHRSIAFVNSSRQKLLQRKDMANGNGWAVWPHLHKPDN